MSDKLEDTVQSIMDALFSEWAAHREGMTFEQLRPWIKNSIVVGKTIGLSEGRDATVKELRDSFENLQKREVRARAAGARAMQKKCTIAARATGPTNCRCNFYHGGCECGFTRMTTLIENISALKPEDV